MFCRKQTELGLMYDFDKLLLVLTGCDMFIKYLIFSHLISYLVLFLNTILWAYDQLVQWQLLTLHHNLGQVGTLASIDWSIGLFSTSILSNIWRVWVRHKQQCAYVMLSALRWRHNECDGVSNHQPHDCLLNRLFRHRSEEIWKLRVTGLWAGNSPVNSPDKGPVTRKMLPFAVVIMVQPKMRRYSSLRSPVALTL